MHRFQSEFEELEELHLLDCAQNLDLWALHYVCMGIIQEKLDKFKHCCNNHPLRTEKNKTPLQLHTSSSLLHEVRRMEIDLNSMHLLNEWLSNNNDIVLGNQVNADPIHQFEFPDEMMINMQNIKNSNTTNQLKCIAMRDIMMSN